MARRYTTPEVADLCKRLREGADPVDDLGAKFLSMGAYKTVYVIGAYVIKEDDSSNTHQKKYCVKKLRQLGADFIPEWKAGEYVVQPKITPIAERKFEDPSDRYAYKEVWNFPDGTSEYERWCDIVAEFFEMHQNNVGVDDHGNMFVFDW
jgi:hypothetical protein